MGNEINDLGLKLVDLKHHKNPDLCGVSFKAALDLLEPTLEKKTANPVLIVEYPLHEMAVRVLEYLKIKDQIEIIAIPYGLFSENSWILIVSRTRGYISKGGYIEDE